MKQLRRSKISRLFFYLLAAIVFNFSFDTPDSFQTKRFTSTGYQDNLIFNDYESYYEFFTEFVFGLDDHIEEQQEAEQEQNKVKLKKIFVADFGAIKIFYLPFYLSSLAIYAVQKLPQGKPQPIFLPPEL